MSYVALYRKWRPQSFDDVIGQEHIIQTLKNQIKSNRIAHAYLFCGTRGTGKTSTAKIFAKAVNCLNPIDSNPCNECEMCKLANRNQSMNVIEIDAASNNSVDNIREIREEVKYMPTKGKYKVYIIDEVHMLSTGAFNALLKTLEEPPAHIIFILATTEPHKILPTILSRCQRYDFKRISINDISKSLNNLMEKEQIKVDDKAIHYIARVADGAMRDALSILDQCISFYLGKEITLDKVLNILGAVDVQIFFDITDALHDKNALKCIKLIDEMMVQGRDISQFILDWINHLRNLLVLQSAGDTNNIIDMSSENIELLRKQSQKISTESLTRYIQNLSQLENQIKYATQKRVLLEVTIIKLCQPEMDDSYEALIERIKQVETKLQKGIKVIQSQPVQLVQRETVKKKVNPKPKPKAVAKEVKTAVERWQGIKQKIIKKDRTLIGVLEGIKAGYLEGNILYLICPSDIYKNLLIGNNEERFKVIRSEIELSEGKEFNIKVISQKEYNVKYKEIYGGQTGYDSSNEEDINNEIKKIVHSINFDVEIK